MRELVAGALRTIPLLKTGQRYEIDNGLRKAVLNPANAEKIEKLYKQYTQ